MLTFKDLPGELVLRIVAYAVTPDDASSEDLVKYVRRSRSLQLVSKQLKAAVDRVVGLHFHAFRPVLPYALKVYAGPWHPAVLASVQVHRCYWQWHQGHHTRIGPDLKFALSALTLARLPNLRTLSLDLRAHEPFTHGSLRLWKTKHAPRWVHASAILTHLLICATSIEDIVIRLSPQQELIDFVLQLIAKNRGLKRIQIDIDSAVVNGRNVRPVIHLDRLCSAGVAYTPVRGFILRAPSCDVRFFNMAESHFPFYKRLAEAEDVSISCCTFSTNIPNPLWIATLLRATSQAHVFEICIERPDDFDVSGFTGDDRPILLPNLYELGIQVPDVDTSLLRLLRAPDLYAFRFHTAVPVQDWNRCSPDHFPSLFIAQLSATGPSADRLRNLGVPLHKCAQNLQGQHDFTTAHSYVLNAFIKPYDRPRPRAVVPFSKEFLDSLERVLPSLADASLSDDGTSSTLTSLDADDGSDAGEDGGHGNDDLPGSILVSGSTGDQATIPSASLTSEGEVVSSPADVSPSSESDHSDSAASTAADESASTMYNVHLGYPSLVTAPPSPPVQPPLQPALASVDVPLFPSLPSCVPSSSSGFVAAATQPVFAASRRPAKRARC
ncbi:hypothetical protein OC834_006044 [Tilletia horrida]|nr:hypothetical protein OC834_006044 [Tilletia horrida]